MQRYIDVDLLKYQMYHEAFEKDSDMQRWDSGCWIRYKMFENVIKSIPNADVVERKMGTWVLTQIGPPGTFDACTCSECGAVEYFNQGWKKFNFCPNCGAEMRITGKAGEKEKTEYEEQQGKNRSEEGNGDPEA